MHLLELSFEPVQLVRIDAAVGPAFGAYGVERDESHVADVLRVVGLGHEFVALDRPPLWVRLDLEEWAGHELLGLVDERFHRGVGLERLRQRDRLARARDRPGQCRRDDADALA